MMRRGLGEPSDPDGPTRGGGWTPSSTEGERIMTQTQDRRLGWLGTGRMGVAMAERLLDAGEELVVWNRTKAKTRPLADRGCQVADGIGELAERCDVVFVVVTASADLLEVVTGPAGLLRGGSSRPSVIVDFSTVSAEASAEASAAAAAVGVQFLASPISGNPDMVAEGTAAIVASGPDETFEQVRHYLDHIAPSVTYAGPGQTSLLVKLCHNLMLGMTTQALVEVTALAEKGGVARADFLAFINGSVLGSTLTRHKGQALAARDYRPTVTTTMLRKDYDLGLGAARALEVPMPVAATVHQVIHTAISLGYAEADYASLFEVAARAAGLRHEEEGTGEQEA
ncbi:3-hydroxyisobutyrate dehydrogenase-like beta-hydroxyacid dehydrogenase [Kitasatospora viridis]|uniref:3-hydroxyisobutyrate dehydrogenase-like beta-hydroxyacid dehydrogenase n=2 Tax=Kitasatospora viridis TaxID=281105 RepID=A0A561SG18_9ACTN|nr:3-hydroxyisobutyrate dehydrogenase-like beta-hydroxyacid dehydrogenase [Kitasatospora viridis]